MTRKSDIGLIGLAVMGENLALNMERNGFQVSVYNRAEGAEAHVVEHFLSGRAEGKASLTSSPSSRVSSVPARS